MLDKTREKDTQRSLKQAIQSAKNKLVSQQHEDGHWVYHLEADCTIPAEYILMNHFVDEIDDELESKIAIYIREHQAEHDGWPLFYGGVFDLSCSVKSYYALKMAGDDPNDGHMVKARNAILQHGGAAHANVFTRILMAMFEQVPWRATPFIPAEIILLPKWFPFHIDKVSYWSRTVMVPLFVLCTLKARAANPRAIDIRELFVTPPEEEQHYFRITTPLTRAFLILDHIGMIFEKLVPKFVRNISVRRCEKWFTDRMNEEHGIGGIFPAMVNVYESLIVLGHDKNSAVVKQARKAIDNLLVDEGDRSYCQPCNSPVWDTALACQTLIEIQEDDGLDETRTKIKEGLDWLKQRQLSDEPGDWRIPCPKLEGGGWAFQYSNYYYPDLDDTAMVAWAMHRADDQTYAAAIQRAAHWLDGMKSKGGGFGSFEVNNTQYYLNYIPFADHGALLDPPTADVTGRSIALLSLADKTKYTQSINNAIRFLKIDQEDDGSWFGRWGTNYIYGTWSVLTALELAEEDPQQSYIRRAVSWLEKIQNQDGGWGESNESYYPPRHRHPYPSTSFQTAWSLLGLLAVGEVNSTAVKQGISYLLENQKADGFWDELDYTAPGFPRVFYLKYHGYAKYFPLWALARYNNLKEPLTKS
jgi:squalene-hopene/tetraprenyl-beta-curcumene cyclase